MTSNAIRLLFLDAFEERVRSNLYFSLFEVEFSWSPTLSDLNIFNYFFQGYLKDRMVHKNPHKIPKLETVIELEVEAIFMETVTKVLYNFLLRLLKVVIFGNIIRNIF